MLSSLDYTKILHILENELRFLVCFFKTVIECKHSDSTAVRNHCHTLSIKSEHWEKDFLQTVSSTNRKL